MCAERGPPLTSPWSRRSDGRSPRQRGLRRQPDSLDSVDSCSSVSSYSSTSHFHASSASSSSTARRFRFHSKSPSSSSPGPSQVQAQASETDVLEISPTREPDSPCDEKPQFTSRGTFNSEKSKQKLKGSKHSALRHSRDGGGHSRDPADLSQQLVLYGNNEFMV